MVRPTTLFSYNLADRRVAATVVIDRVACSPVSPSNFTTPSDAWSCDLAPRPDKLAASSVGVHISTRCIRCGSSVPWPMPQDSLYDFS